MSVYVQKNACLLGTISGAIILFLLFSPSYDMIHFINIVFYVFLFALILTLFLYVKKGGFYDGIAFSFKRFMAMIKKEQDYMEEWKKEPLPSEKGSALFYSHMQYQTVGLLVFVSILMGFHYLT